MLCGASMPTAVSDLVCLLMMKKSGFKTHNAKLTCRQHNGALNLEEPPALMRDRAFQKSPICWRSGEVTG
jgi:hypothetical protein